MCIRDSLPLLGYGELLETWVAAPCAAIDVMLQTFEQAVLAAAAEQEVGTATQVLLKLAPCSAGRCLQRAMTHADVPQGGDDQQGQHQ